MNLTRVTFTGADDNTDPQALVDLAVKYPFIEWGILVSKTSAGRPRYPSFQWLDELAVFNRKHQINLSCHLCGRWLRDILTTEDRYDFDQNFGPYLHMFQRMQLNTHGQKTNYEAFNVVAYLFNLYKTFVVQMDGVNEKLIEDLINFDISAVPLYDLSSGAGTLPSEWRKPVENVSCTGYAGGLGPQNLEEQLEKIQEVVGDKFIWIDMETHVRSNDDKLFDLEKIEECCEIVKPYIYQSKI
jgi:hypothetical protein